MLNFAEIPKWSPNGFIKKISPVAPSTELRLVPDEILDVQLTAGAFKPVILKNTPEEFAWCGSLPYIFTGTHRFIFAPSKVTPGGTTFTQSEEFSGALAWLMGDSMPARAAGMREGTKTKWEVFNQDLKKELEK
jgi:hypothetical protein